MKKYCLHPGFITSKRDGDKHYIGAGKLADCYGVSWRDCQTFVAGDIHIVAPQTVCLYPSFHGDYRLPAAQPAWKQGEAR